MSIETTVTSLDQVEESIRGAYVEADGKFSLDIDKYAELKAAGLKGKNKELLDKLAKQKDFVAKFEKFKDLDLDEFEEFVESRKQQPEGSGGQGMPGQPGGKPAEDAALRTMEKQLKKLQSKLTEEGQAWQQEREKLTGELRHYKLTSPLKEIALKAGVLPEDLDVALLETAKRFRLDDNGKIVVLDDDGDPTTDTPEKFFKDIYRLQRPKFYAATGAAGSGAGPNSRAGGNGKVITRAAFDKLGAAEAMDFVKKGGQIID